MPPVELHQAPLLRFWTQHGLLKLKPPEQDLGGRLASWLDVRQAIQLHQQLDAPITSSVRSDPVRFDLLQSDFDLMMASLKAAIEHDRFAAGLWRNPMPSQVLVLPLIWDDLWEPYRRYMVDHQKQMALALGRWRRQARHALSRSGGALDALARLDAVYDLAFAPKETRLLSTLPIRMGQLLLRRVREHIPDFETASDADSHPLVTSPAWLAEYETQLRLSLLAELELRSQPLLGLIEAMKSRTHEKT